MAERPNLPLPKYETFAYRGQTRYRCPHCEFDHYNVVEVDRHVLHTHELADNKRIIGKARITLPALALKGKAKSGKGDPRLLGSKRAVNFIIAEQYLGITARQRQKLMKSGLLKVEGKGLNRKITVESLLTYLPPENPN